MVGLLLLVALFVGGAHHHVDGNRHPCAVCTVVHAPAVASVVSAASTAPEGPQRVVPADRQRAPRPIRLATASSRAPPSGLDS